MFLPVASQDKVQTFMKFNLNFSRQDCGYAGISSTQCQSRGCCWDSSVPNVPWCFHGPSRPTPFPTTPAPPTTLPPSKWDCNFEQDFCNWNNSKEDDFNWWRQSGGSPSIGTGPTADHTTGSQKGQYSDSVYFGQIDALALLLWGKELRNIPS